jgi:hypothetical protein
MSKLHLTPRVLALYKTILFLCITLQDPDAVEQLVVRTIPRPSSCSVLVGDVVVLESPVPPSAGTVGASNVMVRRGGACTSPQEHV